MRTLYALFFVCLSFQASAFDLGALNEAIAVESHDNTAAAAWTAILSEDEALDPLANWAHLDYDWDQDTTASIPETGTIDGLSEASGYYFVY
jgi:hypothetical protein